MIREWLEANGWTCVRSDEEGDLYTKGNPVCMNTEAALFQEVLDLRRNFERNGIAACMRLNANQRDRINRLESALNEIHQWLVCAAIATPEDMAQSFENMESIAAAALGVTE